LKILFLAAANAIHTLRWVNGLAERGHDIFLVSAQLPQETLHPAVIFLRLPIPAPAGYFLNAPWVRAAIRAFQPDLLHAHYASGYGTLARLTGFHPTLLSVWGSDVYAFPEISELHRCLLEKNLRFADQLASTSLAMQQRTLQLLAAAPLSAPIAVTPFGVELEKFAPKPEASRRQGFFIGTVKTLSSQYGIDLLLRAFALARLQGLPASARLLLVGGGPQEAELKQLSCSLHLETVVDWIGQVSHADVPHWLNQVDLYVALSRRESFGVAVIEASACARPVLVSDVGGLPEVVKAGDTGFVVPGQDIEAAARQMRWCYEHQELAQAMGQAGRKWVSEAYHWPACLQTMEAVYAETLRLYSARN